MCLLSLGHKQTHKLVNTRSIVLYSLFSIDKQTSQPPNPKKSFTFFLTSPSHRLSSQNENTKVVRPTTHSFKMKMHIKFSTNHKQMYVKGRPQAALKNPNIKPQSKMYGPKPKRKNNQLPQRIQGATQVEQQLLEITTECNSYAYAHIEQQIRIRREA